MLVVVVVVLVEARRVEFLRWPCLLAGRLFEGLAGLALLGLGVELVPFVWGGWAVLVVELGLVWLLATVLGALVVVVVEVVVVVVDVVVLLAVAGLDVGASEELELPAAAPKANGLSRFIS